MVSSLSPLVFFLKGNIFSALQGEGIEEEEERDPSGIREGGWKEGEKEGDTSTRGMYSIFSI